jgi:hypothetical protein
MRAHKDQHKDRAKQDRPLLSPASCIDKVRGKRRVAAMASPVPSLPPAPLVKRKRSALAPAARVLARQRADDDCASENMARATERRAARPVPKWILESPAHAAYQQLYSDICVVSNDQVCANKRLFAHWMIDQLPPATTAQRTLQLLCMCLQICFRHLPPAVYDAAVRATDVSQSRVGEAHVPEAQQLPCAVMSFLAVFCFSHSPHSRLVYVKAAHKKLKVARVGEYRDGTVDLHSASGQYVRAVKLPEVCLLVLNGIHFRWTGKNMPILQTPALDDLWFWEPMLASEPAPVNSAQAEWDRVQANGACHSPR